MRVVAGVVALLVWVLSGCAREDVSAFMLGFSGHPELAEQQRRDQANRADHDIVIKMWGQIWEETGDPFEARRQVYAKHFARLAANPVLSRNLDNMTALAWVGLGGEVAGAICYMQGFQFGTAHHDQCVYEVKMGRGLNSEARAPSVKARPRITPLRPAAREEFEQDRKVYDESECIGPVIMGRCHGSILPNKAVHPTCYGAWLNGECTGPMF